MDPQALTQISTNSGDWSQMFATNQFLSGGFVLLIIGGIFAYLRHLPGKIWSFLERFLVVKIDIQDSDESYQWMCLWLSQKLSDTLSVSVITRKIAKSTPVFDDDDEPPVSERRPSIFLVPAVGTYFFWYKSRFVICSRDRKENEAGGGGLAVGNAVKQLTARESLHIRIFSLNRKLAYDIVEEARNLALPEDGKLDIRIARHSYWELSGRISPRPLESVILPHQVTENILADMTEFLSTASWYQKLGIPYRRGYLLEGPPGGGKSSLVKAIAGVLGMNIYVLNLSDNTLDDNNLNQLFFGVADKSIILIEDVDCAFVKRKIKNKGDSVTKGNLTFSGLLNAIDGIASGEGRIVIMTTNHKEKIDPALVRPGRVDMRVHIGNASQSQAQRLFLRFFPDKTELAYKFASAIEDGKYSMAFLQGYLQTHRKSAETAIEMMDSMNEFNIAGEEKDDPVEQRTQP